MAILGAGVKSDPFGCQRVKQDYILLAVFVEEIFWKRCEGM